jgi:hypothetical protein
MVELRYQSQAKKHLHHLIGKSGLLCGWANSYLAPKDCMVN